MRKIAGKALSRLGAPEGSGARLLLFQGRKYTAEEAEHKRQRGEKAEEFAALAGR
jgi:hypothetical protein